MVAGLDPDAGSYSNVTDEELDPDSKYVFRLYAIEGTGVATAPDDDFPLSGEPGECNMLQLYDFNRFVSVSLCYCYNTAALSN